MQTRAKSRSASAASWAFSLLLAVGACGGDDDDDAQSSAGAHAHGRDSGSDHAGSNSSEGSMGKDASADSGRGSNAAGHGDQAGSNANAAGDGADNGGRAAPAGQGGSSATSGTDGADSGNSGSGDGDAGDPPDDEQIDDDAVPMFVAQGDVGRLVVSCDDGVSWSYDKSDDDTLVCFESNNLPDCNHSPTAGRGIAFGAGHFVATFGWGDPPGGISRSVDGKSWSTVLPDTVWGGIAYGNGVFLAGGRTAKRSTNAGESWSDTPQTIDGYNVRRSAFIDHDGGRFVIVGDNGDIALSRDNGASFYKPTTIATGCGATIQWAGGIATDGAGRMLIVGGDGVACYSDDDGDTWTMASVGGGLSGHLLWSGSEFLTYGNGKVYRSSDGASWTSVSLTPGDLTLGAVARNPDTGTFVAVSGGWQQWYSAQHFYRSADGIAWQAIDPTGYMGGHPIRHIAFGYGLSGGACPAPP